KAPSASSMAIRSPRRISELQNGTGPLSRAPCLAGTPRFGAGPPVKFLPVRLGEPLYLGFVSAVFSTVGSACIWRSRGATCWSSAAGWVMVQRHQVRGFRHRGFAMACGACLTATVLAIGPSAEGLTRATQLWVARYNGPANGGDDAYAVAVSPDGSRVFVTGASESSTHLDYATVAYNASTGHKLWVARYNGPARGQDVAFALAVSPDGSKVFATGESDSGRVTGFDYATVAYDASTGAKLWVA